MYGLSPVTSIVSSIDVRLRTLSVVVSVIFIRYSSIVPLGISGGAQVMVIEREDVANPRRFHGAVDFAIEERTI